MNSPCRRPFNCFARKRSTVATSERDGMVVVVVLIVVMLIALAAYSFVFFMRAEYRATRSFVAQSQARAAAESGIEYALSQLELSPQLQQESNVRWVGVTLEDLEASSSEEFAQWRFTIVSPKRSSSSVQASSTSLATQAGWVDESAKINLLELARWEKQHPGHAEETLMNLPGLDDATRELILSHLSISRSSSSNRSSSSSLSVNSFSQTSTIASDTETELELPTDLEPEAVESFEDLPTPPRPGPQTLPSQFAVGGDVSSREALRALLDDSPDWDGNYRADEARKSGWLQSESESDSTSARMQLGSSNRVTEGNEEWRHWVTLDSAEKNQSFTGSPRIDLNEGQLLPLHQKLLTHWNTEWANFIVLYRQYGAGGSSSSSATQLELSQIEIDFSKSGSVPIESLVDLIGAKIRFEKDGENYVVASPFTIEPAEMPGYIHRLFDEATARSSHRIAGRINILTAPTEVLLAIPTIELELAEGIVQARGEWMNNNEQPPSIGWLLVSELVDTKRLKELEPYITVRGDVRTAQVVGYRDDFDPICRIEAILDGSRQPPRLTHYRELQQYGRGFSAAELDSLAPFPE